VTMGNHYQDSVIVELNRLSSLGWNDWKMDSQLVKSSQSVKPSGVSFPSDWYNPKAMNSEAEGFWAETRAEVIRRILKKNHIKIIWEVGAGNGNVAIPLRKAGIAVIGIEPLRTGAESLANSGVTTYWGTLEDLAFPDGSIDAIGIFDVLEHLERPEMVMKEILRVLKHGGLLVTTVPAHQWLFSDFDLSIGHFRRYSRKSLNELLTKSGFTQNKIQSLFLGLVLPAFILRTLPYKLGRKKKFESQVKSNGRYKRTRRLLQILLKKIFILEGKLPLPIGLSLISYSYKSGSKRE
jgi:2-polyprenyl-3-methyl-5-hydroxy-6-metoxy-1,4-benzoquinol methylase